MEPAAVSVKVVKRLAQNEAKLALSESCTAGLIAASLGGIPGVSNHFCGSAVVYREQTKIDWLGVSADTISQHTAVSAEATSQITQGVLQRTEEADWAMGITGHLGPGSPSRLDGQIFIACFQRLGNIVRKVSSMQCELSETTRIARQQQATTIALSHLLDCLEGRFDT